MVTAIASTAKTLGRVATLHVWWASRSSKSFLQATIFSPGTYQNGEFYGVLVVIRRFRPLAFDDFSGTLINGDLGGEGGGPSTKMLSFWIEVPSWWSIFVLNRVTSTFWILPNFMIQSQSWFMINFIQFPSFRCWTPIRPRLKSRFKMAKSSLTRCLNIFFSMVKIPILDGSLQHFPWLQLC